MDTYLKQEGTIMGKNYSKWSSIILPGVDHHATQILGEVDPRARLLMSESTNNS